MRLIFKSKNGKIYRLTDPEATVSPDEWVRVINLITWLRDLSRTSGVNLAELMYCTQAQL